MSVCREIFDAALGDRPTSSTGSGPRTPVTAEQLLDVAGVPGDRTMAGLRANVEVAIRYLAAWLGGNGAVGIHGLMEDAATAEISRSQVWQWVRSWVELDTGETVTDELVRGWSPRRSPASASWTGWTTPGGSSSRWRWPTSSPIS